jgi:peptide/nickel transport system permease protein
VLVVSVLAFLLPQLSGTDPTDVLLGPESTDAQRTALRAELGLDRPLPVRYLDWLGGAWNGDLGQSLTTRADIGQLIGQRAPVTLTIAAAGLVVALVLGVGLGVLAAARARTAADRAVQVVASLALAVPPFWFAMIMVLLFAVQLPVFYATGWVPFSDSPAGWLRSVTLPAIAVSLFGIAHLTRITRTAMLGVLASDHIRSARVKGLPASRILFGHALPNALPPVIASAALVFVAAFGASAFVEVVFALPGLGQGLVDAASKGDVPFIQGVALLAAVLVATVNLAADLLQLAVDPRARAA